MYKVFTNVIQSGSFELSDMLNKIDNQWVAGKLTSEERDCLINEARIKARPEHSIDMLAKLSDLEQRVAKLEGLNSASDSEDAEEPEVTYEEYIPGKWYYNGMVVMENGELYTCIAPEGQVCTWSPSEYPPYWEKITQSLS